MDQTKQSFMSTEYNKKYQSFFSHALSHYQTSLLFFSSVFIVFVFVFLSLLCIILFSLWLLLSMNDEKQTIKTT